MYHTADFGGIDCWKGCNKELVRNPDRMVQTMTNVVVTSMDSTDGSSNRRSSMAGDNSAPPVPPAHPSVLPSTDQNMIVGIDGIIHQGRHSMSIPSVSNVLLWILCGYDTYYKNVLPT